MIWHNFKYGLLVCIRNKTQILWSVVFVIVLGTMFKLTFGDIYNQDEKLKDIKVAVCIEDSEVLENFKLYMENISIVESGEKLLDIRYMNDKKDAEQLLKDGDVLGVFYEEGPELKLLIQSEDIRQSILASLVSSYHQNMTLITEVAKKDPALVAQTMKLITEGVGSNTEIHNSKSDMDVYAQYFYNLIAMACIMSVSVGTALTINNHANTSMVGARREISGAHLAIGNVATLIAGALIQTACVLVSFGYLMLIGVNFHGDLLKILLIMVVGIFTGTSMGYCIGSMNKISSKAKDGIATAISVGGSFFSGLMIMNVRMYLEERAPFINRVNPVALVSDSFYSINTFETDERMIHNLVSLMIISIVFIFVGNIIGRRKQYASL